MLTAVEMRKGLPDSLPPLFGIVIRRVGMSIRLCFIMYSYGDERTKYIPSCLDISSNISVGLDHHTFHLQRLHKQWLIPLHLERNLASPLAF